MFRVLWTNQKGKGTPKDPLRQTTHILSDLPHLIWGLLNHLPHCATKILCEHPGMLVD